MTPSERKLFELARQVLWRYRQDTPLGHQPHMIAHEADKAITDINELLSPPCKDLKPRCFADFQPNHEHDRNCQWCAVETECKTGESNSNELDRIVEWAEDLCGVGHAAWDTIDPRLIASAILEAADNLKPQRTWVGLTPDEIRGISLASGESLFSAIMFTHDKLKEKNT